MLRKKLILYNYIYQKLEVTIQQDTDKLEFRDEIPAYVLLNCTYQHAYVLNIS